MGSPGGKQDLPPIPIPCMAVLPSEQPPHYGAECTAVAVGQRQEVTSPHLAGSGFSSVVAQAALAAGCGAPACWGEVASTAVLFLWHAFPFMGCLFCNPQVF